MELAVGGALELKVYTTGRALQELVEDPDFELGLKRGLATRFNKDEDSVEILDIYVMGARRLEKARLQRRLQSGRVGVDYMMRLDSYEEAQETHAAIEAASADMPSLTSALGASIAGEGVTISVEVMTASAGAMPPPPGYVEGPRVSNAAYTGMCENGVFGLADAVERCSASSLCSVLHDFNCDGSGWRYCSSSLEVMGSLGYSDTKACTFVRVDADVLRYIAGPRVANMHYAAHCDHGTFTYLDAMEHCNTNAACSVLHDFNCDGGGWRYCTADIRTMENSAASGDMSACTAIRVSGDSTGSTETTTPAEQYVPGPRVSNGAFERGVCSAVPSASLADAEAGCTANPLCSVLHDYNCDGLGWRHCSVPISMVQAFGWVDSLACTLVSSASTPPTADTTLTSTAELPTYSAGPRVGNGAYWGYCSGPIWDIDVATAACDLDPLCSVLHDYNCDGHGWRPCSRPVATLQAASTDSLACTWVASVSGPPGSTATTTTVAAGAYVDGPRVTNDVFATHCSPNYADWAIASRECDAEPSCEVIHDYNCDGKGWRICTSPLPVIEAASAGGALLACTMIDASAGGGGGGGGSTYSAGPRVGNTVHAQHCNAAYGPLDTVKAYCDADSACTVLHDFNCDGRGWRYCTSPIQTLVAASGGAAGACTLVQDGGQLQPTATSTATPAPVYVDGPRVGNGAYLGNCGSGGMALQSAMDQCNADPLCSVLHDFGCDGGGWRVCTSPVQALQSTGGGGTKACTMVAAGSSLNTVTTTTPPTYEDGPRVSNGAFSGHCDSTPMSLAAATDKCNEDTACHVLHDYMCDGGGWRYCTSSLAVLQGAWYGDTQACTRVVSGSVAAPASYVPGPSMSNGAYWPNHCGTTTYWDVDAAKAACDASACSLLHDYNCDSIGWRVCSSSAATMQGVGADTLACTLLRT